MPIMYLESSQICDIVVNISDIEDLHLGAMAISAKEVCTLWFAVTQGLQV